MAIGAHQPGVSEHPLIARSPFRHAFRGLAPPARGPSATTPFRRLPWRYPIRLRHRASFTPRRLARHLADAFEPHNALARDSLKLSPEFGRVIGDQFRPVARAADLDVAGA